MTSRRTISLLLSLAVMATVGGKLQADDGPIVLGRRERGSILTLDPFKGSLGLNGMYAMDSSTSGRSSARSSDTMFQEQLTLTTGGGVVSKNLFDWSGTATVGLDEEWSKSDTRSESQTGFLNAYSFQAGILENSMLPSSFFARRAESFVNRSFAALLQNTTTGYGGAVSYRSPILPSVFRFSDTTTTQSDLGGQVQFTMKERDLQFQSEYQPTDRNDLTLNYQFANVQQENPGEPSTNYDMQNLVLMDQWMLDSEGRYLLTQSFDYTQQSGIFAYSQMHLGEQLRMHHTTYFETSLAYNYNRQEYSTSTSQTHAVTGGFTHRLFESLTTTGQAGVSQATNSFSGSGGQSDSTSQNFFTNGAINYNKKVPLGQFNAHVNLGYSQTDNGAVGQVQQVQGDQVTFSDITPVVLTRTGINPSSIKVFDKLTGQQFFAGSDFTVRRVGNAVWLQGPASGIGPIADGQRLLLDYNIDPLPGYTSTITTFGFGSRYDFTEGPFNGLGFFGQYTQQDQVISTAVPSLLLPDNVRDTLFGADYHIWKVTLHAEHENRESTLTPQTADRFSAHYSDRISDRTTLSLGANQLFITYPSDGSKTDSTTADGRMEYQIDRNLKAIVAARWRNQTDSRYGHTMGFEEQGELRWKIRQTDIYLTVRHTSYDAVGSNSQSMLFQFGISRNF